MESGGMAARGHLGCNTLSNLGIQRLLFTLI